MSELTPCNWCSWQSYKRRYGNKVRLVPSEHPGWEKDVEKKNGEGDWERVASFLKLTNHCAC